MRAAGRTNEPTCTQQVVTNVNAPCPDALMESAVCPSCLVVLVNCPTLLLLYSVTNHPNRYATVASPRLKCGNLVLCLPLLLLVNRSPIFIFLYVYCPEVQHKTQSGTETFILLYFYNLDQQQSSAQP